MLNLTVVSTPVEVNFDDMTHKKRFAFHFEWFGLSIGDIYSGLPHIPHTWKCVKDTKGI